MHRRGKERVKRAVIGGVIAVYAVGVLLSVPAAIRYLPPAQQQVQVTGPWSILVSHYMPWVTWVSLAVSGADAVGLFVGGIGLAVGWIWGIRVLVMALVIRAAVLLLGLPAQLALAVGLIRVDFSGPRWSRVMQLPPGALHHLWWFALVFDVIAMAVLAAAIWYAVHHLRAFQTDSQTENEDT